MRRAVLLSFCLAALAVHGAAGQTPPAATDAVPPATRGPPGTGGLPKPPGTVPEIVQPAGEPQLKASDVADFSIQPPDMDRRLVVPAPGTPGGDRSVNPK